MANVVVEMSGDEARLYRSMQKIVDQQAKLDAGHKKVAESGKKAGKEVEQAGLKAEKGFGHRAVASLHNYAAGFVSISSAVQLTGEMLNYMKGEADKAFGSLNKFADANAKLAQVATSGKDYQALVSRTNALAVRYGADRGELKQVAFDARSMGFEDAVPDIAKYSSFIRPTDAAQIAGMATEQGLFAGKGLSPREILAMVYTSSQASKLDFEQYAPVVPLAAQGIMQAGGTPAESLAALQAMVPKYGRASTAGDRIMHFGAKVGMSEDPRLKGKGLEAVRILRDEFSAEERKDFLKDSIELNDAYNNLAANYEQIRKIQAELETVPGTVGTPESPFEKTLRAQFDPSTEAGRNAIALQETRRAAADREVANEEAFGAVGGERQAALDRALGAMKGAGISEGAQFFGQKAGQTAGLLGFGGRGVETAAHAYTFGAQSGFNPIGLAINALNGTLGQHLEQLKRSAPAQTIRSAEPTQTDGTPPARFGLRIDVGEALERSAAALEKAAANLERKTAPPARTPSLRTAQQRAAASPVE